MPVTAKNHNMLFYTIFIFTAESTRENIFDILKNVGNETVAFYT